MNDDLSHCNVLVSCLQRANLHKCNASRCGPCLRGAIGEGKPTRTCILSSTEEAFFRLEDPSQAATHSCDVGLHDLGVVVHFACQTRWQRCQANCYMPYTADAAVAGCSEFCIALEVRGAHLFQDHAKCRHRHEADFGCIALQV